MMFSVATFEERRPRWTFAASFTAQTLVLILPFLLPHSTHAHLAGLKLPQQDHIVYQPDDGPQVIELAQVEAVDHPKLAVVEKTADESSAPRHEAAQTQPQEQVQAQTQGTSDKAADDAQDDADHVGVLASSGRWMMDPQPPSYTVMQHHVVNPAQPVYTPDPDALHHVTESARGENLVFQVVINEDGVIAQASILKGAELEVVPSIVETLRQWLFVPAKMNGVPVATTRLLMFH
ncbi:MAG: hypothetical protein P4M01_03635, partial [Acidobacteriota bacterium]|nr:hypothetical protein [Acidobacteriota bacterium]